eukprot:Gb_19908 [translate_table: standard]
MVVIVIVMAWVFIIIEHDWSAVDQFKRQFTHLEEHYSKGGKSSPLERQHASLPRERIFQLGEAAAKQSKYSEQTIATATKASFQIPTKVPEGVPGKLGGVIGSGVLVGDGQTKETTDPRGLVKSASISGSQCIVAAYSQPQRNSTVTLKPEVNETKIYSSSTVGEI